MIFQKTDVEITLMDNSFRNLVKTSTYFAYFLTRKPKKIFNVIFIPHNDEFSKNERCDYPYGVSLPEIRLKQVLIRLFPDT